MPDTLYGRLAIYLMKDSKIRTDPFNATFAALADSPGRLVGVVRGCFEAGEVFRYVWRTPDATEMDMSGVCLEFKPPERLVATEKFDQPWYPGEAVGTIALAERDGVTELPQTIRYESPKAREIVLATPIEHGMAPGYDRLAALLESRRNARRKVNG